MKPATTEEVLELMDACFTSAALGAAIELGLFWLLDRQSLDAAGVAESLGIPANRCSYWLQLLNDTGLIEQGPDGYAPSGTARTAILDAHSQASWALLAQEARERLPILRDLTLNIRVPGSAYDALGLTPPQYLAGMAANPEAARRFARMLYELHQPLADALAKSLDLSGASRIMDLGGGSGVVSLALLRRYPGLTAVVVDIANVCTAGREIAAENHLQDRITYHPADFVRDDLPSGFDAVVECDVGVYSEALFRKVWSALRTGGRFVIVDQLAPAEGVAPPSRVHWAFQASMIDPGFSYQTARQLETQLQEVGFQVLSQSSPPLLHGEQRFTSGMVLIEASK
jgi:SAM-dependent methyltransferase